MQQTAHETHEIEWPVRGGVEPCHPAHEMPHTRHGTSGAPFTREGKPMLNEEPSAEHLARVDNAARITLIDGDTYDDGNLAGQNVSRRDLGRPKVAVQARCIRRIAPQLRIETYEARVEDLPLAALRGDVIFSCLDNRAARRYLTEAAWRLQVPLIDGAVDGGAMTGRVGVYKPGADAACLLCAWSDEDYAAQEQIYACRRAGSVAPTHAPAELGAMVASMMVAEARRLFGADYGADRAGAFYMVFDVRHQAFQVTSLPRNPQCRFDHRVWSIEPLSERPSQLTVGKLLDRAAPEVSHRQRGRDAAIFLPIPAQGFARRLVCPECAYKAGIDLRLEERIAPRRRACRRCKTAMLVDRFDVLDQLDGPELNAQIKLRTRLSHMGFVTGDVVAVVVGGVTRHFELGAGGSGAEPSDSGRRSRISRGSRGNRVRSARPKIRTVHKTPQEGSHCPEGT